jgi:hypothetical protein
MRNNPRRKRGHHDEALCGFGHLAKFGDDHRRYMQRVPRLNIVAGVIRLLRRGKVGDERR